MQQAEEKELMIAIAICDRVHEGQVDKGGSPYRNHPIRLMNRQVEHRRKVVAVLHDVIEDSNGEVTKESLIEEGISPENAHSVDCISRRKDESYSEYLRRVTTDEVALDVKIDDIDDNMDLSRIQFTTEKDYARTARYQKKRIYLLDFRSFKAGKNILPA